MPQRLTKRIAFTKGTLTELSPPLAGTRATYYDEKNPKLALRITAAGTRTFYVIKHLTSGEVAWIKLGAFPEMTVERARKAADKTLGEFASGTDPAQAKREARAQMTLGAAFEDYMARHVAGKGRKSGTDLRRMWERCLGAMPDEPRKKHARPRSKHPAGVNWQYRRIDTITRDDVAKLHVALGKTTPIVANRVVELLSAVYGKLAAWGVAVSNPATGIEPFAEAKRDRFLQRGELPRFFAALATDPNDDFRDFIVLSLLTGARRGNVLAMRWVDVRLDDAVWRIPAAQAKAGEAIDVALVPEAVTILEARQARAAKLDPPSAFVFAAESATRYLTPPKKRWAALLDRIELDELVARIRADGEVFEWANDGKESLDRALVRAQKLADDLKIDRAGARLEDLRLHDLRRSLGSWQAKTGASLAIIGKTLGHRTPSATAIYARLDIDPVRAAVETATSAMLVAAEIKKPAAVTQAKARRRRP
jgi:integrase